MNVQIYISSSYPIHHLSIILLKHQTTLNCQTLLYALFSYWVEPLGLSSRIEFRFFNENFKFIEELTCQKLPASSK